MNSELALMLQNAAEARRLGDLKIARQAFQQALEASRLSQDEAGKLVALKGLGQVERDAGNIQEALHYLQDATHLARRHAGKNLLAHTIRHYADACRAAGRLEEAQSLYQKALTLYREEPATPELELANALRPAAIASERLGHKQEASDYWREARSLYESAGIQAGVLECDEGLSRCAHP